MSFAVPTQTLAEARRSREAAEAATSQKQKDAAMSLGLEWPPPQTRGRGRPGRESAWITALYGEIRAGRPVDDLPQKPPSWWSVGNALRRDLEGAVQDAEMALAVSKELPAKDALAVEETPVAEGAPASADTLVVAPAAEETPTVTPSIEDRERANSGL